MPKFTGLESQASTPTMKYCTALGTEINYGNLSVSDSTICLQLSPRHSRRHSHPESKKTFLLATPRQFLATSPILRLKKFGARILLCLWLRPAGSYLDAVRAQTRQDEW